MFVMLGLLVTPSALLVGLIPALIVALALTLVARPLAVMLCVAPFRFHWREHAFLSWVGLRGAVPIFLGTIPVLADVPFAQLYFDIAFVVVLVSLLVQGWTVSLSARLLNLALPSQPPAPQRTDLVIGEAASQTMAAYTVEPMTLVVDRPMRHLPLPPGARIVSVVRDDDIRAPDEIGKLAEGDRAIVLSAPASLPALDALFAARATNRARPSIESLFGEFTFDGVASLGAIGQLYDLEVPQADRATTVGDYVLGRLRGKAVAGDRVPLGGVELVVRDMTEGRIVRVGIELEPESWWHRHGRPLRAWLGARFKRRGPAATAAPAPSGETESRTSEA